jgi:hypothetical protein
MLWQVADLFCGEIQGVIELLMHQAYTTSPRQIGEHFLWAVVGISPELGTPKNWAELAAGN